MISAVQEIFPFDHVVAVNSEIFQNNSQQMHQKLSDISKLPGI